MRFPLQTRKAIEAAGILLSEFHAKDMEYIRLLKLLYIIDRESILQTGLPMLASDWCAMKNGPLHSSIYDLIKSAHPETAKWQEHFDTRDKDIYRCKDPGVGALSRRDVRIIREVGERNRSVNTWDLVEKTHDFKEWKAAFEGADESTSRPISPELMYRSLGMEDELAFFFETTDEMAAVRSAIH